jgi:hypothetical protein
MAERDLGPYSRPENAFQLIAEVAFCPGRSDELERLRAASGAGEALERMLLVLASQHALPQVSALPVDAGVQRLLAAEFDFFADPPPAWLRHFRVADLRYREMCRLATFQRFPAGQFEWQVSEFRRSWIFAARRPWRLLAHVVRRMGGFGPLFELHVNPRRKSRLVLLENEANVSYHRVARSLEMQPEVRGAMLKSWLFCESTARVTPRLQWLRRTPLDGGAFIAELGEAPPESGFLTGSEERRALYVSGEYLPRIGCVLWPRDALIEWANRQPVE